MLTRIVLLLLGIRKPIVEKLLMPQSQSSCLAPNQINFAIKCKVIGRLISPVPEDLLSFQRKKCELVGAWEKQRNSDYFKQCVWVPGDESNGTK